MRFNSIPDLSNSEISDLGNLSWKVECHTMVLERKSLSPEKFFGPGMIYQAENGTLHFKLYVIREKRQPKMSQRLKAGQLIPDSAYFDLSATDSNGRTWKSKRIFLSRDYFIFGDTTVIDHQLFEISCTRRVPKKNITFKNDALSIWVFEDFEIPCNELTVKRTSIARKQAGYSGKLNAWKFRTLGINFLLVKHDEKYLTVRASTKLGNYPLLLEERALEALQFILGKPIPWTALKIQKKQTISIKISSKQQARGKPRLLPPLPVGPITEPGKRKVTTKYHRRLFECYLKHTLTSEQRRHPIWGYLNAVYEAGTSSYIDSEALALVVAIEGLVQTEFAELINLSDEDKEAISLLQKYIDEWEGNAIIKKRAKGAVSQFHNIRADDIMRKLEEMGAITSDQRKGWGSLRHPSAHTFQIGNLSGEKIRKLLPNVKILFYHLIFYAIGYRGLYTDVASLDWPLKEYKPNVQRNLNRMNQEVREQ